jgi:hypothetical protein
MYYVVCERFLKKNFFIIILGLSVIWRKKTIICEYIYSNTEQKQTPKTAGRSQRTGAAGTSSNRTEKLNDSAIQYLLILLLWRRRPGLYYFSCDEEGLFLTPHNNSRKNLEFDTVKWDYTLLRATTKINFVNTITYDT